MDKEKRNPTMKKPQALLYIYKILMTGGVINKRKLAEEINVSTRTIDRYLKEINDHLWEKDDIKCLDMSVEYDESLKRYVLKSQEKLYLTKEETLAMAKLVIGSKVFSPKEQEQLLKKLAANCYYLDQAHMKEIIFIGHQNDVKKEKVDDHLIRKIWDFNEAIREKRKVSIEYQSDNEITKGKSVKKRILLPQRILFSGNQFYVTAYIEKGEYEKANYPTAYAFDGIKKYKISNKKYQENQYLNASDNNIEISNHHKIEIAKIKCKSELIDKLLDRFPEGEIVDHMNEEFIVQVEGWSEDIKKWVLSQGTDAEVLKPQYLRDEIKEMIHQIIAKYE